MDPKAGEVVRQRWGFTSWQGIREAEEKLLEKKRSALRMAGWHPDPNVSVLHGQELWRKELDGVLTALPLDSAVRLESSRAREDLQNEVYMQFHEQALQKEGRDAGPAAINPYPPGSFGHKNWAEGHDDT